MNYLTRLDELRRAELFKRAREFASTYDPDLPTIVILPGGMGSRLQRCTREYDAARSSPIETFEELWCGLRPIFEGKLASLSQDESTIETDRHPIIAAGELTSVVKSYNGIFEHFAGKANVIGLGYDWRRAPAKESGYVRIFLQLLAEQVKQINPVWPDPRKRVTLYAHSQGGLVAKFFLNDVADAGDDLGDWCERVVTCCTPFYGTSTHFERYYVGEPLLNLFTGGADAVARIVASFQGTYLLLPGPREVLRPRLSKFGLTRYPVRDFDDERIECDPFDASAPIAGRHRPEVLRAHLEMARDQFVQVDRPLPQAVSNRVFHIRSDTSGKSDRPLELRWKAVDGATYGAYRGTPISLETSPGGQGDGTVPLWSARLADTPDRNVIDMLGVSHGGAAEHPLALQILSRLMLGIPVQRGPHLSESDFKYASAARISALVAELRAMTVDEACSRVEALPPGDYRALVERLRLSA
jgi:hypothetical protein